MPSGAIRTTRTLIIDNYDSYTYNLYQLLAEVNGEPPVVVRNDEKTISEIQDIVRLWAIDNIVVSPGPGSPECPKDVGVCREVYKHFRHIPILGVCLGHQLLADIHGSKVVRAPEPIHGRLSDIAHNGHPLFEGVPSGENSGFHVVRYHSLTVDQDSLPPTVTPIAWTTGYHHAMRSMSPSLPDTKSRRAGESENSVLMAIAVTHLPHFGVQFHPESVGTAFGIKLLKNFRDITCKIQCRQSFPFVEDAIGPPGHNMPPKSFVVDEAGWEGNVEVLYQKSKGVLSGASDEMDQLFDGMFGREQKAINAFWLDSASADRGRFSFMGGVGGPLWQNLTYKLCGDVQMLDSDQSIGELSIRDSEGRVSFWKGNLWDYLNRVVKYNRIRVTTEMLEELPFNFWGGYVGYFGYELKALSEGRNAHKASTPDACLFLADRLIAIDHKEKDVYFLAMRRMDDDDPSDAANWINWAQQQVSTILKIKKQEIGNGAIDSRICTRKQSQAEKGGRTGPFILDQPRANYLSDIQSCLDYMHAGESYEICLTNKLRRSYSTDVNPYNFYTMLRRINPAPYAAFLSFGSENLSVCCSSPERFLRGDRGAVLEAKPIKGTAARHADPTSDSAAAHDLYFSEKDQAENLMIVDLLRNDLGRVCEAGSVFVKSLMEVESYTTVHQLVSTVKGIRKKDVSIIGAIRAAFPGGSMTGAPKVRTMEILDKLEGCARGVYSGSIGYIGFNDTFDLNIVIRSAIIHGREMTIGAGGAIVVQSGVEEEYDEMILKTKALVRAVEMYDNTE